MTYEERINHWLTSQPDCTRAVAKNIVDQEDAEAEIESLLHLLHEVDPRFYSIFTNKVRRLAKAIRNHAL